MKERRLVVDSQGAVVRERRLDGLTFVEFIKEQGQGEFYRAGERILRPSTERFERFEDFQFSEDGLHVMAIGIDEDRVSLIRDGEVVFSQQGGKIRELHTTADYSRLVAICEDQGKRQRAFLISDKVQEVSASFSDQLTLLKYEKDLSRLLFVSRSGKRTYFNAVSITEGGVSIASLFSVKGKFDCLQVAALSADYGEVVWIGSSYRSLRGEEWLFHQDRLLLNADYISIVRASVDPFRYLATARTGRKYKVVLNGAILFSEKDVNILAHRVSEDLDLGMIGIIWIERKNDASQILAISPKGVVLTRPFDILRDIEADDDRIVARIRRGGIEREIVVARETDLELMDKPSAVEETGVTSENRVEQYRTPGV